MKTSTYFRLEWSKTASMNHARRLHIATILTNGQVLVSGGFANYVLNSAELYDQLTGRWTITASMND